MLRERLIPLARAHPALALLVAVGAVVRLAVAIAYEPALFFSDSWAYAELAADRGFAFDRPSGYPFAIAILWLPGRSLLLLTTVQHLAGLATGILAYALLHRLGAPRWAAAAAASLVLLDAYAIALEQHVMAESLFTLAAMLAMYLVAGRDRALVAIAAAGVLLGGAATMRTLGLFVIPPFVLYVLLRSADRRVVATTVAIAASAFPLVLYSGVHAAAGDGFRMTQIDGWALYSRVAGFADCGGADIPAGTEGLCQPAGERFPRPSFYGWDVTSPANRLYGADRPGANDRLRAWARAIVRHQPREYAEAVGADFLRFFRPTRDAAEGTRPGNFSEPILLPAPGDGEYRSEFADRVRAEELSGYEREIDPPQSAVRAYLGVIHVPRPLMGLLALASLAAVTLTAWRRIRRRPSGHEHTPEVILMSGAGLLMLLAAASVEFQLRYLIPSVPLLACGGTLAALDLWRRYSRAP
ncbi:MAG TPA: phospholipid carrier-dependent glycosyltransferase [Thermoleophilaceae bacterium]|nr:phospholipid carrier-dependent glycosyltransferase [Thermoleophilaceae bacterium]